MFAPGGVDAQPSNLILSTSHPSINWIELKSPVNRDQILSFLIKSDVTTNADSLMFYDIGGVESGHSNAKPSEIFKKIPSQVEKEKFNMRLF